MGLPANYINFFDICKREEIPEGTAKSAISVGLKGINRIEKLRPIANLFRSFSKGERNQYGILKKYYDNWKQTGELPRVAPKVKNIRIVAPPFDPILDEGLKKMNKGRLRRITKQELIWLFIKEGMERRPQFFDWNDVHEE